MSDSTQGEGWWQASDGKWYPPEQHPDFSAGATQAMESVPPPTTAMPVPPPPPPGVPIGGPPPGGPGGPPPGAPGAGSNNTKWIIVGVLAVAAVAIAAFLLLGGDDDKQKVAASSSSPSASSSSSSSKSSSSSSKSSSSKSSSSTSSSSLTDADIKKLLLTAKEVGPDFIDDTFVDDSTSPTFCGQPNLNQQVPPLHDIGSASTNGVAFFQEEALGYTSVADAKKVLDLIKNESTCPAPTVQGGGPIQFSAPKDVSSDLTTPAQEAIEIDFQTEEAQGQFFVIRDQTVVLIFQFVAQQGTDTSLLPDAIDVVNKGLAKIVG